LYKVDHIAIRVSNLDLAQKWYEERLGAKLQYKDQYYRRMLLNNTTLALIDEDRYPSNHIGVLVEDFDQLPNVGTRIEHRDGTVGVYVKDPFGYTVEYIWYSPETKQTFVREKNE
tara:strand:- start:480 stop:824 length:345 start_codon:yes stop_codon:yes gene_type:complete